MAAQPSAVALLELGKLLDKPSEPAKRAAAEQQAVDALYNDDTRALRDALRYDNNGRNIEPMDLRILALLAYRQLCTSRVVNAVGDVACAVAGDSPAEILEARQAIGNLLFRRQLHLADNCGNVQLNHNLLAHLGGHRSDAPVATTQQALDRAWAQAEERTKSKKEKPGRIPTARELAVRIGTEVVGLDQQVRTVACRTVLHMHRAGLIRESRDPGSPNECLLLVGPSGCGKTFLLETAGRLCGLPFASFSATDATCTGYVGQDISDVLRNLLVAAGGDTQKARTGVAFIDEIDKRRTSDWEFGSRDVAGTSVQQELLRMIEGAEVQVGGKRSYDEPAVKLNTRGTFFAMAGAFVGLDKLLAEHCGSALGFGAEPTTARQRQYLHDALVAFGILVEVVNRLTGILVLPEPTLAQLHDIATRCTIPSFNRLLSAVGASIEVSTPAVAAMAEHALATKTYARGLKSLVSRLVEDLVFNETKGTVKLAAADVRVAIDAAG